MNFIKSNWKSIIVIVIFVAAITFYGTVMNKTIVENNVETPEELSFVDNEKIKEIRNREEVRRQQELIVEEIYLTEEKENIQTEKEKAIKRFDAQIADVEIKLETVREEKLSFQ
ncbi:MAG: hypothetical protein KJI69_05195 [Patescibacteria group bacterium]|nr:hypothetical protein [Patescibacteria group bacterium]